MTWLHFALLSAFFAGLVGIFGKAGVGRVEPSQTALLAALRAGIMALSLVAWMLARRQTGNLHTIAPRAWIFIVLTGLCGAAAWSCEFRALELGQASRVIPVDKLSLLITVGFAALFLGEKLTPFKAIGAILILAGTLLIARG